MDVNLGALLSEPWLIAGIALTLLFVGLGAWRDRVLKRRLNETGDTVYREKFYREFHAAALPLMVLCTVFWLSSGRSLGALGFSHDPSLGLIAAWLVALAISGYMIYGAVGALRSEKVRAMLRRQLETGPDLDLIRPESERQLKLFLGVSATAGFAEEVIFRGFLIGALALAMPVVPAAIVATLIFVAGHAYQGWKGVLRVLPLGVIFAALFVVSGSLIPGILLHFIVDAAGGVMMYQVGRTAPPSEADPTAA